MSGTVTNPLFWAKIVSWHIVRATDGTRTLCGLSLNRTQAGNTAHTLPSGEKSCESCLRSVVATFDQRTADVLTAVDPTA